MRPSKVDFPPASFEAVLSSLALHYVEELGPVFQMCIRDRAHNAAQKGETLDLPGLAASFAAAVSDTLVPRTMEAARRTGYGKVAVAGGVAANSRIRADLERACRASGHRLYLPALSLCGDNGAMIG